jgi:hypothetical protein
MLKVLEDPHEELLVGGEVDGEDGDVMLVEDGEEILLTPIGFTWLRFHLKI